jgi:hypothetical protein
MNKWKGKLVVFEVLGLIFCYFFIKKKGRATPASKESSPWKMAKRKTSILYSNKEPHVDYYDNLYSICNVKTVTFIINHITINSR